MFKKLFVLVFLLFTPLAIAQTNAPQFALPNTMTYELTAKKLKRTYPIYVSVPRGYNSLDDKKYPVVIMNDGPYAFPVAAAALSVPMSMGIIDNVILVGIGFSKGDNMMLSRIRDYSPSVDENFKHFKPGQAEQYLDFLENEVLPFIETHYAIDSSKRTLVGHSAGGLFASHVLLHHTALFESYVILSPALFWNNKQLFTEENQYASQHKSLKSRVYFATGSGEVPPAWSSQPTSLKVLCMKPASRLEHYKGYSGYIQNKNNFWVKGRQDLTESCFRETLFLILHYHSHFSTFAL